MNFNGSFMFVCQKLSNSLLFDALWQGWERVIHFEPQTAQISVFQAVLHTKMKDKEQPKSWDTYHFKYTLLGWDTYVEPPLFEWPV